MLFANPEDRFSHVKAHIQRINPDFILCSFMENSIGLKMFNEDSEQSIAGQIIIHLIQGENSAILLTFIKLPFVIKIFVLYIFEWSLKTGFTLLTSSHFYESFNQPGPLGRSRW